MSLIAVQAYFNRILFLAGTALLATSFVGAQALDNAHPVSAEKKAPAKTPSTNNSSAVIPAPRIEQNWLTKHNDLVAKVRKGGYDIAFFGDSITEGMLTPQVKKEFGPNADHFGIGGDRTQHLLWRFQNGELDFPGNPPKLLVMLIGTNNLHSWPSTVEGKITIPAYVGSPDEEIFQGVEANIMEVQKKLPSTKILILGLLPRDENPKHEDRIRIKDINSMLAGLANDKKVFYIDIGDKLLEKNGTIAKSIMPDFLHPSELGYSKIFEAIKPTVNQILAK